MKVLKQNLSVILMTLLELTVGILLLINPEEFTRNVIIIFGIVMLLIGIVDLIKYLSDKKSGYGSVLTLTVAIILLIIGLVCTFIPGVIMGIFSVIAVLYGIIMFIIGIYKCKVYTFAKKIGLPMSVIMLISAILSIVIGVVIVFNPFSATMLLWEFIGISIIVEAVIDLISLVHIAVKQ